MLLNSFITKPVKNDFATQAPKLSEKPCQRIQSKGMKLYWVSKLMNLFNDRFLGVNRFNILCKFDSMRKFSCQEK